MIQDTNIWTEITTPFIRIDPVLSTWLRDIIGPGKWHARYSYKEISLITESDTIIFAFERPKDATLFTLKWLSK